MKIIINNIKDLPSTKFCTAKFSAGLTLIEILVTLSILIFILSLGLFVSFDSYRGYIFRSERSVVLSVLEKARSRAINNYYQTAWGVCYDDANKLYVTFRGASCTLGVSTNETIPSSLSIEVGFSTPIVFEQLTGKLVPQLSPSTKEATTTISNGLATTTIYINNEGRINW